MAGKRNKWPITDSFTWDVYSVIFDVHLMQASLSWGIFHCDCAVLVIGNIRLGHFSRRHSYITCKAWGTHKNLLVEIRTFLLFDSFVKQNTCNFSFLDGERNDQVEGSQTSYVQSVHAQLPVCSLWGKTGESDRSKLTMWWTLNSD